MRITIFLFLLVVFSNFSSAYADCLNPAGIEGEQVYNSTHKTMQFCDGTNWYSMKGGTVTTLDALSCSNGQVIKWNNGSSIWECANDDSGGAESDPTVAASVKDGVSWSEVSGKPAEFADGTDDGITSESDPQVSAVTSGKWCRGTGSAVTCDQDAPSVGVPSGIPVGGGRQSRVNSIITVVTCHTDDLWGEGYCSGNSFGCNAGTTKQRIYNEGGTSSTSSYDRVYLCIKD